MNIARELRHHVADLLAATGPDAPTLCAGWSTRDLAAHLVIRDRRPDAMPGIAIEKFAGHTRSVQDKEAAKDYGELVERVRSGPPAYNPMSLPPVDAKVNTSEYAIHAEDIRRAQPTDRRAALPPLPAGTADAVWATLPMMARMILRGCPVNVTACAADRGEATLVSGKDAGTVRLLGDPVELLLLLSGRDAQAAVTIEGSDTDKARFAEVSLGL